MNRANWRIGRAPKRKFMRGNYFDPVAKLEKCDECIDERIKLMRRRKKDRGEKKARSLNDLEIGEKGVITRVQGKGELHRRLLDMGVVPATVVEVKRVAPLGDPIEVRVRGYHLSLRREEAKKILVDDLPKIDVGAA